MQSWFSNGQLVQSWRFVVKLLIMCRFWIGGFFLDDRRPRVVYRIVLRPIGLCAWGLCGARGRKGLAALRGMWEGRGGHPCSTRPRRLVPSALDIPKGGGDAPKK